MAAGAPDAAQSLFAVEWMPLPGAEPGTHAGGYRTGLGMAMGRLMVSYPPVVVAELPAAGDAVSVVEATHAASALVLGWVQDWLADAGSGGSRLVVVTRGATDGSDLAAAAVWGLVRSAQSEHPHRFILLDLDDHTDHDGELGRILTAVVDSGEPEIAVRAGDLYTRRLTRAVGTGRLSLPGAERLSWRIDVSEPGSLDNLAVLDCPEAVAPLAAGQVRGCGAGGGVELPRRVAWVGYVPGSDCGDG